MEIEVGFLPKRYYDSNPDAGGFFPFAFEGTEPYVLALEGFYYQNVMEISCLCGSGILKHFHYIFVLKFLPIGKRILKILVRNSISVIDT